MPSFAVRSEGGGTIEFPVRQTCGPLEIVMAPDTPSAGKAIEDRLDSWKEIAAYLERDVTTVQRWEKREAMPVHRHLHEKRGSVYAVPAELDCWIQSRKAGLDEPEAAPAEESGPAIPTSQHRVKPGTRLWFALAVVFGICLSIAAWLMLRHPTTEIGETRIPSLAVLPLRNLSGDPGQEYLADGMTEALIGRLAGIRGLRVVSHTSVMRFKTPQMSVPEIARMLGVDSVVEGSVIREGDRIRVTAQLIRASTDTHFWSETYDRQMSDALTLESELAQSIAEKVQVTLTGEERQRLTSVKPVAPEVYESYLKGRFVLAQGNRAQLEQSIPLFEDALHRDAAFAPAYLGLAEAYTMLGTVSAGVSPEETRPKVADFARQALAIDPGLVEAHVMLANVLQEEWHWAEAQAEYKRALALNPNNAEAYQWFALWLVCQGRADEAVTAIQHARALDPVGVSGGSVAWILFQARHYDEAIREESSALATQPNSVSDLTGLGFSLIANNQPADAIPFLEKAVSLSGSPAATGVLIRAYAHAGRRSDALRLLAQLNQRKTVGYVPSGAFVNAYLGLDDKEQAFYWLEQAYREKSNILQFLKSHPYFDPIRSDPRFADLVHRVGLP
ncbi:tetratricopeptide repeat protein [Terriglobus roseus]|uniref:TolB amino-terminal domain-containing protein n=1 Tax=Terriglobus roseus TaxID=392734 RepID=A0A1G7H8B5_9BACT|nr:tetratricopeptide repeat protein [Terriglobus roseus]SDE96359.1 TolB amino-terminal domain-containing protein [Terriglobus roseus]